MPIVLTPTTTTPPVGSPTLADLERELGQRTGPFHQLVVRSGAVSLTVPFDDLASTIEQGPLEGLYFLRRGVMAVGGAPVSGFDPRDRQRMVATQDAVNGTLEVDRGWIGSPVDGEAVELYALDPTRRLRPAVRRGLDRCFFEDRVAVALTTYAAERDLTALIPWLRDPDWVLELSSVPTGSVDRPVRVGQWTPLLATGRVSVGIAPDPAAATLYVRALRPHSTWVNGADSTTGPTLDADVLVVALDYAVCMAHDWLWDTAKDALRPIAAEGFGNAEGEVRQAAARYRDRLPTRPDRILLPSRFRTRWNL